MSTYTYNEILQQAKTCQKSVKNNHELGMSSTWGYYFAKAILNPQKNIPKLSIAAAKNPSSTYISNQIYKSSYIDICNRLTKYIENNRQLPNYVTYKDYKLSPRLVAEILSRILIYYQNNKKLPAYANANSKVFTKPVETNNEVYNYFVKVFGAFDNTIDGALAKIAGKGYGYYYDDVYSNKQSIDRMKKGQGVNCTDSCQVFYNIMLQLIELGKYRKVECLHIKCRGGDGHVRLRITMNDGNYIYRDPAAVLDSGSVTKNWCSDGTLLSVNPSWFMQNLKR